MTVRKNFEVTKGYTMPLVVGFKESDKTTPQDLTGHTITLKLFDRLGTQLLSKTDAGDTDGFVDVTVTDEDSATLPVGEHVWHLQHFYPNGDKVLDGTGRFTVKGGFNA